MSFALLAPNVLFASCCHMGFFGLRGGARQLNQPGRVVDAIINRNLNDRICYFDL
jgi:hypothetical protein